MTEGRGRFGFPRLKTEIDVWKTVRFEDQLNVSLAIGDLSAKLIEYRFSIRRSNSESENPIARGRFEVACCRFPKDALPFAILIPESVLMRFEQAIV